MAFNVDENGRVLDANGNPLTADPRRNAYNSGMFAGADGYVYDMPSLLGGSGGGGGGSENAVEYVPQELTEEQQMQARENLGLYYTEAGAPAFEPIAFDGDTTGKTVVPLAAGAKWVLVGDAVPPEKMVGATVTFVNAERESLVVQPENVDTETISADVEGVYMLSFTELTTFDAAVVVTPEDRVTVAEQFVFPTRGVYVEMVSYDGQTMYPSSITAPEADTVHKIEPKYLPDGVVTSEEQTLTEDQQMQTRKNLGVYNKVVAPAFEDIVLDENTTWETVVDTNDYGFFVLLREELIPLDKMLGAHVRVTEIDTEEDLVSFDVNRNRIIFSPLGDSVSYAVNDEDYGPIVVVAHEDGAQIFSDDDTVFPKAGVYVYYPSRTLSGSITETITVTSRIDTDVCKVEAEYLASVDEQTRGLTDDQITQIRKNLGLYRTETVSYTFDGDLTGREYKYDDGTSRLVKISDDVVPWQALIGASVTAANAPFESFTIAQEDIYVQAGYYKVRYLPMNLNLIQVLLEDDADESGATKGVYVLYYYAGVENPLYISSIVGSEPTAVYKIDPEYLPDTIPTKTEVAAMIAEALASLNGDT